MVVKMLVGSHFIKRNLLDGITSRERRAWPLSTVQNGGNDVEIGLITVFDAILTGRQSGQKLQCLYGNPIANNFFQN